MSEPLSIEQINKLQEEVKILNRKLVSTKCPLCKEGFLTPEGAELYDENQRLREQLDRAESGEKNEMDIANEYRKALEEIREIFKKQLPTEVIQGRFPMIYYSEYFNREKQVLNKISEVLE